MVHDDLLEQIRQPLLDRIDRRLAAILAVSISAHLTIAILGWLNDPPVKAWLDDPPQPAYTVETIDSIDLPDPTPASAEVGTAAVVVAPKPVAAALPAAVPGHSHHRGTPPPKPIDPRALVADLVGDQPSFAAAGRKVGRGLDDQLASAAERDQHARVGKDGAEETIAIGDDGPDVTGVDHVTRTDKPKEKEPPPPHTIIDEPAFPFDTTWLTKGPRFRAAQRCYGHSPEFLAHEPAKVKLTMTLGPTGKVLEASADGPAGLAACIADRARSWSFPVANPAAAEVHAAYVFQPQ